jgi:hypothetical protein
LGWWQVFRFLRRRTESHEAAEDLDQAVFADVAAGLPATPAKPMDIIGQLSNLPEPVRRLLGSDRS